MSNDDTGPRNSKRTAGVPGGYSLSDGDADVDGDGHVDGEGYVDGEGHVEGDGNRQDDDPFAQAHGVETAVPETYTNPAADVRAALGRLAGTGQRTVLERAEAAVDDIDAAVAFVESGGLGELAAAIQATDDPTVRDRGERVLAEFRRFRRAARGEAGPACGEAAPACGEADTARCESDPMPGKADLASGEADR